MLGIILARGGSKGLPGKNIRPLLGKPLIEYTIEHALASKYVKKVVVSTDDEEIASVAKNAGAEVPFMRPSHLASDKAPSVDAILHAVDFYKEKGLDFSKIALLEPTSPLRLPKDIDNAFLQLQNTPGATAIVGMTSMVCSHPAFAYSLNQSSFIKSFNASDVVQRRQELADLYYPEGTIYISDIGVLRERRTFYHANSIAFLVEKWRAFEIDDIEDFLIIEALMTAANKGLFKDL